MEEIKSRRTPSATAAKKCGGFSLAADPTSGVKFIPLEENQRKG